MTTTKHPRDEAEATFRRKETAALEGAKAMADHEAAADATRKKTERLRSERLAKEAADKQAETIAKALPSQPAPGTRGRTAR